VGLISGLLACLLGCTGIAACLTHCPSCWPSAERLQLDVKEEYARKLSMKWTYDSLTSRGGGAVIAGLDTNTGRALAVQVCFLRFGHESSFYWALKKVVALTHMEQSCTLCR
jgi:hypothetical protein